MKGVVISYNPTFGMLGQAYGGERLEAGQIHAYICLPPVRRSWLGRYRIWKAEFRCWLWRFRNKISHLSM
jgi:hypothetical protein